MKANELRIGNWIKVDDLPIEQITLETFKTLLLFPATISKFEGIPLTEEWLLKFGFEESDRTDNALVHKESSFPIWWNDESEDAYHINSETLTHLDFVHQLQNLYFALTGEELITPKR